MVMIMFYENGDDMSMVLKLIFVFDVCYEVLCIDG